MNKFKTKLTLIYLPYLKLSGVFLICYTAITWLLIYQFQLVNLSENLLFYWLPIAIAIALVLAKTKEKLALLNVGEKGDVFLYMSVIAAFALPVIAMQLYLSTATGKLTELQSATHIGEKPTTKYYKLNRHYVFKKVALSSARFEVSGKYNEALVFHLYIVAPLSVDSISAINQQPPFKVWVGRYYTKSVNNNTSEALKDAAYKLFVEESRREFNFANLDDFTYLDRIGNNDELRGYMAAIERVPVIATEKFWIFEARHGAFDERNGNKLQWFIYSLPGSWLIVFLWTCLPPINNKRLKRYYDRQQNPVAPKSLHIVLTDLRDNNTLITLILLGTNILAYIIMVLAGLGLVSFSTSDLLDWGASYGPFVGNGDWWRLFTSMFVHGGLMHVVMNMVSLAIAGGMLEVLIGRQRFILAYFLCGLAAAITSLMWHGNVVSVGASGAIFGLFGTSIGLFLFGKTKNRWKEIRPYIVLVVVNLLYGLSPGIDNAAHIGGLICGLLLGYIYHYQVNLVQPAKRGYTLKKKKAGQEIILKGQSGTGQTDDSHH